MASDIEKPAVHIGRVRGRYFRENFVQGGIDLVQVIPELVTNADAAIAAGGRGAGRISLVFGTPDPELLVRWQELVRSVRSPALREWKHELSCTDDGIGVDATVVERRLGALGMEPEQAGQRGLFGRGLRDVWLAQGAGRIEGAHGDRAVETWFFPAPGDEPYAYTHLRDERVVGEWLRHLGVDASGTRVTVPLALPKLPANARLRRLVCQLVQLRPVIDDPTRELWLSLPGEPPGLVVRPHVDPDPERPVLFDETVAIGPGIDAHVRVLRAAQPIPLSPSKATRLGGLLVCSGRAAHETTLVGLDASPGARHLYGEVRCDGLEELQRRALQSPRPQVVVKVDRSGLNGHHPIVQRLYGELGRLLRPIIAAEERRAGAHVVRPGQAVKTRDQVGLRALNDALRHVFDAPGSAGFASSPNAAATSHPPALTESGDRQTTNGSRANGTAELASAAPPPAGALRFKQSPIRLHPGEQRGLSLLIDPSRITVGTPIELIADPGLTVRLEQGDVPQPNARGWARVSGTLRARVSVQPGSRLGVLAQAGEHTAELEVLVVRHRASGWVREIARKEEDAIVEAHFDPEEGVVTVFEGRREFKALERAARAAGLSRVRVREYLPYRMLEVEVASNAVYQWAAEQIVARRLADELPTTPADYAAAVRHETQVLRHRVHDKLMRAFLDPEVFDGGVRVVESAPASDAQTALVM